jgi:hypothetical protein
MGLPGPGIETRTEEPVRRYPSRVSPLYSRCVRIHSQIRFPTPHSVRRCNMVSFLPHSNQFSVSTNLILCNLTFVGIMSRIAIYHADLAPSHNFTLWGLPHSSDQSIAAWSCMMRTSRGLFPAVDIVCKVSHTSRIKDLSVTVCLWGSIYAHSRK